MLKKLHLSLIFSNFVVSKQVISIIHRTMNNPTITLRDLTIGYPSKKHTITIARNLNGCFGKGELTSLLGRNGCGKSTLLRTITGFQPKLSGEITLMGKPAEHYDIHERALNVSIVTTEAARVQGMTVYDLVAMGRSPHTGFWGKLSTHDREMIEQSIAMVGIQEYTTRDVTTLSDGEQQKCMIAKAIAQETPIIILDEPTSFLDYPSRVKTISLLRDLAHDLDKTIILSTHDLEQAVKFSDRLWLMDKEKGLTTGTPQELVRADKLTEYFGL